MNTSRPIKPTVRYGAARRRQKLVRILFGTLVGIVLVIGYGAVSQQEFINTLPACTSEDSLEDCYWDGGENGLGAHFYVLNGEVHYVG